MARFILMLFLRRKRSISSIVIRPCLSRSNVLNILRSWFAPLLPRPYTLSRIRVSSGMSLPATLILGSRFSLGLGDCGCSVGSGVACGSSGIGVGGAEL